MNQPEFEPESLTLTTPGIAAAFATAILVVIALTAVPLGQVDALLHLTVQFFAWSAAFLGGCLVLNVAAPFVAQLPKTSSRLRSLFKGMWHLWLTGGAASWGIGAMLLWLHFELPAWQFSLIWLVVFSSICVSTVVVAEAKKASRSGEEQESQGWLNLKKFKEMTPAGYLQLSLPLIGLIGALIASTLSAFSYSRNVQSLVRVVSLGLLGCSFAVGWIRQGKKWGWIVLFAAIAYPVWQAIGLYRL
jgi:hypothetical protein